MPNGSDRAKHEANPAILSKLPAVAIPTLGTIDNCCAKKSRLSNAHTKVATTKKPSARKNGACMRKNRKSDQATTKRRVLANEHSHLGRVMLSVNHVDVEKTDDRTTKVINIMPMTLVASGKVQYFKYNFLSNETYNLR